MSTTHEPQFLLLWKGRQSGPFSAAVIRDMLDSGEISRMHQVSFNGRWMVIDEFMEKHGGGDPEAQLRAKLEKREARLRRDLEQQLAAGREEQNALQERLAQAENRSPLSHLLPPAAPPPPPPQIPVNISPLSARYASELAQSTPPAASFGLSNLAIIGAVLLIFGAFTPVLSIPMVGGITFLKLGWPAYTVIGLAVASLCAVFAAFPKLLWVTGGGASIVLLGCLGAFFRRLEEARRQMKANPGEEGPLANFGELIGNAVLGTIQLQWGCFILGLGAFLILAGAFLASRSEVRNERPFT